MQTRLIIGLGVGLLAILAGGCGPNHMRIIADNQSNQRLEKVAVSSGGKSFEFGVMGGNGEACYMTAERLFGNKVPEKMTLSFGTVDGQKYSHEVTFATESRGRTLRLVIDSKLEVTGKRE